MSSFVLMFFCLKTYKQQLLPATPLHLPSEPARVYLTNHRFAFYLEKPRFTHAPDSVIPGPDQGPYLKDGTMQAIK